jgi:hypothetical protein
MSTDEVPAFVASDGFIAMRKTDASFTVFIIVSCVRKLYKIYMLWTCRGVAAMHSEVWRLN